MAFTFSFSGDDIEPTMEHGQPDVSRAKPSHSVSHDDISAPVMPVVKHDLKEMLATLPDQISYTTTCVVSPQHERRALIPRRALFDVRMQVMAESDMSDGPAAQTQTQGNESRGTDLGFGDSDIEQNVYEGGFKSWEGALDLAQLVLERGPRKDVDEMAGLDGVVELGCGTALPTLVLFQHALRNDYSLPFTLSDYNDSVLRLITLPNLLLVWALQHSPDSFSPAAPSLSSSAPSGADIVHADGDLTTTPVLLDSFLASLTTHDINLTLLSGPWSPKLTSHLTAALHTSQSLLVLAAETIYSPASLHAFAAVLADVLRCVKAGKAIVAAKRVYFGVGGSVVEFKEVMARLGAVVGEVHNSGIEGCDDSASGGVGRALLEVQMF